MTGGGGVAGHFICGPEGAGMWGTETLCKTLCASGAGVSRRSGMIGNMRHTADHLSYSPPVISL
jgi:hypothetical protein